MAGLNPQQFAELLEALRPPAAAAAAPAVLQGGPRMSKFSSADPGEWRIWRSNFRAHALVNNWNNEAQRTMLQVSMEGDAHRHTRGILHHIAGHGRPLDDILTEYDNKFLSPQASTAARAAFSCAKQLPAESLMQWKARLRELFVRANPAAEAGLNVDMNMIEKFVDGLFQREVRIHTRDQGFNNLENALVSAQTKEQSVLKEGPLSHQGRVNHLTDPQSAAPPASRTPAILAIPRTPGVCWTCQSADHYQRDCPQAPKGPPGPPPPGTGNRGRGGLGRGRFGGRGRRGVGGGRGAGRGRGGRRAISTIETPEGEEAPADDFWTQNPDTIDSGSGN